MVLISIGQVAPEARPAQNSRKKGSEQVREKANAQKATQQRQSGPTARADAPTPDSTSPVSLLIDLQPAFETWQELNLVCFANTYSGECSGRSENTSVQMAISGTIEKPAPDKFLVTYNLEVKLTDRSGTTRFSAAGSGLLAKDKPTSVVVIAGRAVVMTATVFQEEDAEPKK